MVTLYVPSAKWRLSPKCTSSFWGSCTCGGLAVLGAPRRVPFPFRYAVMLSIANAGSGDRSPHRLALQVHPLLLDDQIVLDGLHAADAAGHHARLVLDLR